MPKTALNACVAAILAADVAGYSQLNRRGLGAYARPAVGAVHIAARVSALAEPGQVLVSGIVRDLVAGSGLKFSHRGTSVVKGIQDEIRLYSVEV